jgi:hypothetical protein
MERRRRQARGRDDRWLEAVRARPLDEVAGALGLVPLRSAGRLSPCPACGVETTSHRDKRGPVGLRSDRLGWTCHACKAGGDLVALVACHLFGAPLEAGDERWHALRAWAAERGWCEAPRRPVAVPAPRRRVTENTRAKLVDAARADDRPVMDREVVDEAWRAFGPVDRDPEVRAYLEGRGMDAALIADRDLARAIPAGFAGPRWARMKGRGWAEAGYRLAVRMFDADGIPAAIHARNIRSDDDLEREGLRKGALPAGHTVRGLLMANAIARAHLLEHDEDEVRGLEGLPAPSWLAPGELWDVVVMEGATDFLAFAANLVASGKRAALLGIVNGSMQPHLANLLPKGRAHLLIATDPDEDGDGYSELARTVLGRNAAQITRL